MTTSTHQVTSVPGVQTAAAAAGGLCLDRGSLSDRVGGQASASLPGQHWGLTEFHFASGHIELRASHFPGPRHHASTARVERDSEVQRSSRSDAERRAVNGARARAAVRRRVWGLNADRLVTLTRRGGFSTRAECWAALQRWRRLCKVFSWWRDYVAVLELHMGGGPNDGKWHIHLALRGFAPLGIALRLWYRALGGTGYESGADTPGGIDLGTRKAGARPRPRGRIAWYLAKYVAKDFGADGSLRSGERAFSSAGCVRGIQVKRWCLPIGSGGAPIALLVRGLRAVVSLRPGELRIFEWAGDLARPPGFVIYAQKNLR